MHTGLTAFALVALTLVGWTPTSVSSYKILLFVPGISNSQLLLNYRVGDFLASKGHDVTLYVSQFRTKINVKKAVHAKVMQYWVFPKTDPRLEFWDNMTDFMFEDESAWKQIPQFVEFFDILKEGCNNQINDQKLMADLRDQKFDLAIGHMYDFCPLGMIHALHIPTYIWMSSGLLIDYMASYLGLGVPYSYVPNTMSSFSDRMTFPERLQNLLGAHLAMGIHRYVMAPSFDKIFRNTFGPEFPSMISLAAESPLVFINSEELLDFPRPMFHKVVAIGGLATTKPEPLDEEWSSLMANSGKGLVFFSLGSVAPAHKLPEAWKKAFLEAFSRFPDYLFLWKYETEYPEAKKYKNVKLTKWAPQKDLIAHPKAKAFITHCGFNSLLEAANVGIPLVALPLFGDQLGNFRRAERLGFAVSISKNNITADSVAEALREVLTNSSYTENAKNLAKMIRNKPVKADQLLLNWVEFLAEHKRLPSLQPSSFDMSFVEYHLLDVYALLSTIVVVTVFAMLLCVKCVCGRICRRKDAHGKKKPKKD